MFFFTATRWTAAAAPESLAGMNLRLCAGWVSGAMAAALVVAADLDAAEGVGGVVTGRVHYQPDPARPWPLGRYYMSGGFMAEAVVALEGEGLTGPEVAPKTVAMDQKDFMFSPETVAIRTGDSIRFLNSDEALHNVMTFQGAAPFNVTMPQGKEHVHQFTEGKGLEQPIQLTCVFHTAMRAWVFVFPHPYFAVTARDGKFRFENVPPGNYRLHVIHPAGELDWQRPVSVKKGESIEVDVALSPDQKKKSAP
jgi:plastocyanin